MTTFKQKYGPWALITGASSGIGEDFALQCAEQGLNVILVARREDRLTALAKTIHKKYQRQTAVIPLDLGRDDFMPELIQQTEKFDVGLLINNAGFGVGKDFLDSDLDEELHMLHVNCRAPMMLTHHFGQQMKQQKRGGIIMLGSIGAFQAVPHLSSYAASKAFDLLFGEGLTEELKPHGVDVFTLCPGLTATEFQGKAGFEQKYAMSSDTVAKFALDNIGKTASGVPGLHNKAATQMTRLMPRKLAAKLAGFATKRYSEH